MRCLTAALVLLISSFGIADARAASEKMDFDVRVILSCDLYSTRLENGSSKESQLLAHVESGEFTLGTASGIQATFPSPYDSVAVKAQAMRSGYGEEQFKKHSHMDAFFVVDGAPQIGGLISAQVDWPQARSGTQVRLRSTRDFNATAFLSFICALIAK